MIIKIILILFSVVILIWFLTNRNTSKVRAGVRLGFVLLILMAVMAIMVNLVTITIAMLSAITITNLIPIMPPPIAVITMKAFQVIFI